MKENYWEEKGIYYRTNEFKPDRLTLVFAHGVSGSSSAWLPYEKIFENKYNILAYDIRGHGMSKKYPNYDDYEIKKFANDLDDLVTYLNIPKFILISHSFATLIAGEYLKLYGEKVTLNIFLSPIFNLEKSVSAKIIRIVLYILTTIVSFFPFASKPRGHVDYSKHPNTSDWNIKRNIADMRNTTLRVHFDCLRQSFARNQEYNLEKIKIPTLIVHGINDGMAPVKNSIAISKIIKDSELLIIPNTDHIVVLNNAKEISEAIESFLEKNKKSLV